MIYVVATQVGQKGRLAIAGFAGAAILWGFASEFWFGCLKEQEGRKQRLAARVARGNSQNLPLGI
jgi:hypothetical protein